MKEKKMPIAEIVFLALGEVAVSAAVVLIYLLLGRFSYRVITGAVLGSAVTVLNFVVLSVVINRAVDSIIAERGEAPMQDDEAAEFASKHSGEISKKVQLSQAGRTVAMLVVLIVALVSDHFDIIATVVPLLAFRPILGVAGVVCNKRK